MKLYSSIPITECGDPLVQIPRDKFAFVEPHPYAALGAPYGKTSPWMLRQRTIQALEKAQAELETLHPGWKIKFFDAYRPHPVQAYMVGLEFATQVKKAGLESMALTPEQREEIYKRVYRVFAIPSDDPATPPPHSTGAPFDVTLQDENDVEVNMGSPIDENSDRSNPDHFKNSTIPHEKQAHENRELLYRILRNQGFHRHWAEWWHFSHGDQIWAQIERETNPTSNATAIYGRADLSGK